MSGKDWYYQLVDRTSGSAAVCSCFPPFDYHLFIVWPHFASEDTVWVKCIYSWVSAFGWFCATSSTDDYQVIWSVVCHCNTNNNRRENQFHCTTARINLQLVASEVHSFTCERMCFFVYLHYRNILREYTASRTSPGSVETIIAYLLVVADVDIYWNNCGELT